MKASTISNQRKIFIHSTKKCHIVNHVSQTIRMIITDYCNELQQRQTGAQRTAKNGKGTGVSC